MPNPNELVCDECGAVNDRDGIYCELCGDPLDEERREQPRRALAADLLKALGASALVFWPASIPMRLLTVGFGDPERFESVTLGELALSPMAPLGVQFWVFYVTLFAALVWVAPRIAPDRTSIRELSVWEDWGSKSTVYHNARQFTVSPIAKKLGGCLFTWTVGLFFVPFRILYVVWRPVLMHFGFGRPGE